MPGWLESNGLWTLAGVLVGFGITNLNSRFERKRRTKAHWAALREEHYLCGEMARGFREETNISTPLYRLPTMAYVNTFPALLADGAITKAESAAIMQFFTEVETLNRGLDRAQKAADSEWGALLIHEHSRNRLKARRLDPTDENQDNRYRPARAVLDQHA